MLDAVNSRLCFDGVGSVPVVGYQKINVTDNARKVLETWNLPVIESDSDWDWQLRALKSRIEHPEYYPDENIPETIARLKQWLKERYQQRRQQKCD